MEIIIRNGSETGQTRLPKAGYIRTTDRSETSNPTAKVYKPICPSETRPYIKKTMPLPKAARSIAPESNRGICARPSPRRTACNGNETNRHGPVPFVVRRFPDRPPRHSLQRQPSDRAPVEKHNDFGCCKNKEVLRGNPDESQQSPDSPKVAGRRKTLLNRISQRSP